MKAGEKKEGLSAVAEGARAARVRLIDVGIGETAVSRDRSAQLVAYGIGSCVAVCVYDPAGPAAGMAHVLLPNSGTPEKPLLHGDPRYADVAVPKLIRRMKKNGTPEDKLIIKLAGGANVVGGSPDNNNIGLRNVNEIRRILAGLNCRITAEEVCGNHGRTIRFSVATGELIVTTTRAKENNKTI